MLFGLKRIRYFIGSSITKKFSLEIYTVCLLAKGSKSELAGSKQFVKRTSENLT